MCYSAKVVADYRGYVRLFGATVDIKQFYQTFWRRRQGETLLIGRGVEAAFDHPTTDEEREIHKLILEHREVQALDYQSTLFKQRTRLVNAEKKLQTKPTKKASEDKRIAENKIDWARNKLADLQRTEALPGDDRIYPNTYAPVMIVEDGQRIVRLMRYLCRPAGKPAFFDQKYPGCYNARRDSLEGYWKGQFGRTHGVLLADAFYEHVDRHRVEGRDLQPGEEPEDVVLEFRPQGMGLMQAACLWSHWTAPNEPDLYSFAAITDEPPAEVAAVGHDRCIVPLRQERLDDWLNPDSSDLAAQYAILDDRERPYYEHRMAA
jgi:putative SOS response-associated peptidase YedK